MPLRTLVFLLSAALSAGLAVAQTELSPTPFRPANEAESELPILAEALSSADLGAAERCDPTSPRRAVVHLSWQPVRAEGVTAQRVDISKFHEGFDTGRFDTSGTLGADEVAVAVAGPEPGIVYYWRVLTQSANGWVSSRVERFDVPVCPWDPPDTSNLILQTPASSRVDESADSSN